jgi:pyroglutamyl-peptidase
MRVVVFAFEPFGGESVNASLEAARRWAERDGSLKVAEVPVVAGEAERVAGEVLAGRGSNPALVLALGEAAREPWEVRLERTYHNLDDFRIPDNAGLRRERVPIAEGGPSVQYSTIDLEMVTAALGDVPVTVRVSDDAGRFLCNRLAYFLSKSYSHLPFTFVHLPAWRPDDGTERLDLLVDTLIQIKSSALRR